MKLIQVINLLNQNNWILKATMQEEEANLIGEVDNHMAEDKEDTMMTIIIMKELKRNLSE
jgi:hypothetical protein